MLTDEYVSSDTVAIQLPPGYAVESMPADLLLSTPFGEYRSIVKVSGNQLWYARYFRQNSGRFTASAYAELVKFYEQVYKADRGKVVMVKGGQ